MGILPVMRPRLHGRLDCPRKINEQWFEIGVEASLYRLVHTLLKFLRVEPTRGEMITKCRDRSISFGVADPERSILGGPGFHRAVRRRPHPHHVAPGKVEPPRAVSSHD